MKKMTKAEYTAKKEQIVREIKSKLRRHYAKTVENL